MYLNEFVNAQGEKFGWATKIEGSNIFNGSFNAETRLNLLFHKRKQVLCRFAFKKRLQFNHSKAGFGL